MTLQTPGTIGHSIGFQTVLMPAPYDSHDSEEIVLLESSVKQVVHPNVK